jgi:aryl-alcohol dehydrogenase-like predicted oxidoreductase
MRHGRRAFLGATTYSAVSALTASGAAEGGVPKHPQKGAPSADDVKLPAGGVMPKRPLGKTGVQVSIVGLGGFHIGLPDDEQTSIRLVRFALDHGVTFLDNCWDYNDGKSHDRMGKALRDGYRGKAFLMTKIDGRTRAAAAAQIDQSLAQLQTDVIDLLQLHEVIRPTDPARAFGPDGAIEAMIAAQKAGKVRFLGFTGHKSPDIHLAMLAAARAHKFRFDAVQMPLNVMDAHYDSFERKVLPVLQQEGIGVLGMKPFGSGIILKSEPFTSGRVTPTECLHYAMGLPTSVVITGCETEGVLKQAIAAAYSFRPPSAAATKDLLARTAPSAKQGEFERYKTSTDFDGTAQHPWWLETASIKRG